MVESNRGNTLRGHWRNKSEQCRGNHRSGRGFYRRLVRRLGLSGRTRISHIAIISALFGAVCLAPATAQTTTIDNSVFMKPSVNAENTFEDAKLAYEGGDFVRALSLSESAASSGHTESQVMAAHILLRGKAGILDYTKAADLYRLAAAQNNADAQMGLGEMALRSLAGLTPSDAMPWFSLAAQAGRQDAMRAIGEMYLKGQGIAPDPDKAADWLARAADFGDDMADRKMADSLFDTDPAKALTFYEKAAAKGDNEAAYIAALMYDENLEIRPNSEKMVALMRQAADSGHAAAQADYGLWVYQGRGMNPDATEAARWFAKSAQGGDQEGQFLYAFTLAKGEGVPRNYEEAYYWLLKSGESGVSEYDQDRVVLRQRLEANVDPAILAKAKARFNPG